VTVVDLSEERGKEVANLVQTLNSKFHSNLNFPSSISVNCDVTNSSKWGKKKEEFVCNCVDDLCF
jgi:predicted DNA-binding ribbon-helix-helix protein